MNTIDPAQNTTQDVNMARRIVVNSVELHIPLSRKHSMAKLFKRYHVAISVDDTVRSTKQAKEGGNRVSWNEVFYFDWDDRSVFVVKVYQKKRYLRSDKLVAGLTYTVEGILGRLNDGVFEMLLDNNSSERRTHPSGMTIRIALAVEISGDLSANELQATAAVNAATEMIRALGPAPEIIVPLDSANNFATNVATEIQTFENTWDVLLQRMTIFNKIVAGIAEIHPYTSLAWSVISAANKTLINQKNRDDRVIRLAGTMNDVFTFVEDADVLKTVKAHKENLTALIQQVTECGYFISAYAKQNAFWVRTAKYTFSDVDTKIADYENQLRDLKTAFLEGVSLQSGVTVFRMMNTVQDTAESIDLNDIPYANGARYVDERGCLPGTREYIIQDICDILNNPDADGPRVCLLTGVAGSGKSAVAHSIARLYDGQKRLGSSYCFLRSDVTRRNPQNFFSTIARDLSDHDPQYKAALWRVVKDNRSLRTSASLLQQVKRLIIEPGNQLHTIGPWIIVVDALDESGDQSGRRDLLRTLFEQLAHDTFPKNLRFLITARPESDILAELPSGPHIVHKQMGDIPQELVDKDIEKFVHHSLYRYTELESAWPNQEWCRLLVRHSQRLFQWASTACRFIEGDGAIGLNLPERLEILTQDKNDVGVHPLDELYGTILNRLFTLDSVRHKFRNAMAVILVLKEPLSLTSLSTLFDHGMNIRDIVKPMGSLLDGVLDEQKPIRPLHTSFRDFLLDGLRSSTFHVTLLSYHYLFLGRSSLACMERMLKFNICDLKDSRLRNNSVPDLGDQITKAIPPHLAYSCQYWMDHMQHTECTLELQQEVTCFFKKFFPFWLEAISLLSVSSPVSYIGAALKACTVLKQWAKGYEIATFAMEAVQFIQIFAPIIRESTPHLYLSAMPQTPSGSPLHQLWASHLHNNLSVTLGHPIKWPAQVHVLQGHADNVLCVAYSPDGQHVASGSRDRTIRIWSAITGQCVMAFPEVHTASIASVAYSPDGANIVSCCGNSTIVVWKADSGQYLAGKFQGPDQGVTSVIYSPDGNHIISGSWDTTIQIWDANSGNQVAGPLKGHTNTVSSLACSPDGSQIVSASHDMTLRIWNPTTGQCIMGPLQGHTDWINSVSYSSKTFHIASGSNDTTIRIWSSTTGECVIGPLYGHKDRVYCVAYSPDGTHIASGSSDYTIRIWSAENGQCVASPLQGHTRLITSIAYSPDGSTIISGSWDKTIHIWNANGSHDTENFSEGHRNQIKSIACSPNGNRVASGSYDTTFKIWDTTTGQYVAGSSPGHLDSVFSVAYSPDGNCLATSSDNVIMIWSAETGDYVAGPFKRHAGTIYSIAYSPDGSCIISGSENRRIQIGDAQTGQCLEEQLQGHTEWVCSVAYSPDGNHIGSGSADKTIRVWNSITQQCVAGPFQGHTQAVRSVAYSPKGNYIASGSSDSTIRIWDPSTGECVAGPFLGHTEGVLSIAYSSDGNHIISGSEDSTIRIWDTNTGQCIAGPFQGHRGPVTSVAYSPEGTCLVSGSADHSIKIWALKDLNTFKEMHQQEDGWIELSSDVCFCWIPPWARHAFYLPIHTMVMSPHKTYKLDCSGFLYGESWSMCWK